MGAVAAARLTMVVGAPDAGKTTLVAHLAGALAASGHRVAVVDADLGQSEIGPPTTVGLGRVRGPIEQLREAEVVATAFVGVTSPAGNPMATLAAVDRMAAAGQAHGLDRLIVDTSGLVAADLGRALKQAKVDLLRPDLLLCLQRAGECEHILRPYDVAPSPRVVRLPALAGVARRSPAARRLYRRERLGAWLAGARPVTLDLRRVVLRSPALFSGQPIGEEVLELAGQRAGSLLLWGERRGDELVLVTRDPLGEDRMLAVRGVLGPGPLVRHALDDFVPMLAGLEGAAQETLGLGVIRAVDFAARTLTLQTAVAPESIVCVTIGRTPNED